MRLIFVHILIFFAILSFGQDGIKYKPKVAWKTMIDSVGYIASNTYIVKVDPIDFNDPGAISRVIGGYVLDNVGHIFTIIDSSSTTVTVIDEFGYGISPVASKIGWVYNSVGDGEAPFIAPVMYEPLDTKAKDNADKLFKDILWRHGPNAIRIEFSNTNAPSITNYQTNYAERYGELPKVQLITYDESGDEWVRQEVPIWKRSGGLLTEITWDLSDSYSGYIILSR